MKNIGLLLESTEDVFGRSLIQGALAALRGTGHRLICIVGGKLASPDGYAARRNYLYDLIFAHKLDVMLVSASLSGPIGMQQFDAFCHGFDPLPVISLGLALPDFPSVVSDNHHAMASLMDHLLLTHGYVRLAFVGGPPGQQEAEIRKTVFLQKMAAAGLPVDPSWIVHGNFSLASGSLAARQLHLSLDQSKPKFQAIVVANDLMAHGVIGYFTDQGWKIPGDCFITGYDNMKIHDFKLTTVWQSVSNMAQTGANLARRLLAGEDVPALTVLESTLLVRQSCGCAEPDWPGQGSTALSTALSATHKERLATTAEMEHVWRLLHQLRDIEQALRECDSFASMRDVIGNSLIQFGYSGFWLARYNDPESIDPMASMHMFLSKQPGKVLAPSEPPRQFLAAELFSRELANLPDEVDFLVVEALHSRYELLGCIMFAASEPGSHVTGSLRAKIGEALKRRLLLEECKVLERHWMHAETMKALGKQAGGVVHEINTPLSVAMMGTSFLHSQIESLAQKIRQGTAAHTDSDAFLAALSDSIGLITANLGRASELGRSFEKLALDQTNEQRRCFAVKEYMADWVAKSALPAMLGRQAVLRSACRAKPIEEPTPAPLKTIGLLLNSSGDIFDRHIIQGASSALSGTPYRLLCLVGGRVDLPHGEHNAANFLYDLIAPGMFDALIVSASLCNHPETGVFATFCQRFAPIPMLSLGLQMPAMPSVISDNDGAMAQDHTLGRCAARLAMALIEGRPVDALTILPSQLQARRAPGCDGSNWEQPDQQRLLAEFHAARSALRHSGDELGDTWELLSMLRSMSDALQGGDNYQSMCQLIADNLAQLGYGGFWMALFDDFRQHDPRQPMRLYLHKEPDQPGVSFQTGEAGGGADFLTAKLANLPHSSQLLVLEALHFRHELLGFILFATDLKSSFITGTLAGQISGAINSLLLLEERSCSRKQLIQSEKQAAPGTLVAGMVHEVNAPLCKAGADVDLLGQSGEQFIRQYRNGYFSREQADALLAQLLQGAESIQADLRASADLISNFKKISADQVSQERRRFKFRPWIEEVLASQAFLWKNRPIKWLLEGRSDIEIDSWPGTMAQIITRLISNTLLHGFPAGTGGTIRISMEERGQSILLRYADDGCGISADDQDKVFQPFFTTRREQGSIGLGLHIVFDLVTTVLGGSIRFNGNGAAGIEFEMLLPRS
jgi:DNA-binding LacI/PurR family transcriptional regulator/signal transduction histidine kinase